MELAFNFKGDLYCRKDYSYIHMPIPMPMPIPRFRSDRFPGFYQFRMEKKELALEMENLYDFSCSLMHIRPFD